MLYDLKNDYYKDNVIDFSTITLKCNYVVEAAIGEKKILSNWFFFPLQNENIFQLLKKNKACHDSFKAHVSLKLEA